MLVHRKPFIPKSDVWSIGVIFYFLLSKHYPFKISKAAGAERFFFLDWEIVLLSCILLFMDAILYILVHHPILFIESFRNLSNSFLIFRLNALSFWVHCLIIILIFAQHVQKHSICLSWKPLRKFLQLIPCLLLHSDSKLWQICIWIWLFTNSTSPKRNLLFFVHK